MSMLLLLVPGLPVALAAALALPGLRPLVPMLAPAAPMPALAAAWLQPGAIDAPWLMLGVRFALEGPAPAFLAFTGLLWALAAVAALAYHRGDPRRTRFFACFLLAMSGTLGLIVAGDAFAFYAFFATMSFASYGLVVHVHDAAALRAGRVYIAFVVAGELALFAGLVAAVATAGSPLLADIRGVELPPAAIALLVFGFGIKLGVMPLHAWLPLAHAAAPVPASAVLSGAMIKAGLFGLLAFLPLGGAALSAFGLALIVAGIAAVPLAAILGGLSTGPKAVLAWSSVGQMGLVAIALGAGLADPRLWAALAPAIVFYAAHHALAKGALFLGVGAVLADPTPAWRRGMLAALAVPAAALAALPLTGGHAAKEALKSAVGTSDLTGWIVPILAISSAATAVLMARLFLLLARQAAVPKPRALAVPFVGSAALALLLVPLWPFASPGASATDGALAAFALVAAGLAAGSVLDRLIGRRRPAATAALQADRPAAEPARARPLAAPAPARVAVRLRVAARRLGSKIAAALPRPQAGAAATVLVLAAMLVFEAWTHAQPSAGKDPAPARQHEGPPP
jgi:formate hydrogenlyase subunit 3/multisubunit Na+/H+ antiporter MnhD subunit